MQYWEWLSHLCICDHQSAELLHATSYQGALRSLFNEKKIGTWQWSWRGPF